jgi:hypothetical protein
MSTLSLLLDMTYIIKLVLLLVVTSLIPTQLTANIPVLPPSALCESLSLLGSLTTYS